MSVSGACHHRHMEHYEKALAYASDAPTIHHSFDRWFWVHSCGLFGCYYDRQADAVLASAIHLTVCPSASS